MDEETGTNQWGDLLQGPRLQEELGLDLSRLVPMPLFFLAMFILERGERAAFAYGTRPSTWLLPEKSTNPPEMGMNWLAALAFNYGQVTPSPQPSGTVTCLPLAVWWLEATVCSFGIQSSPKVAGGFGSLARLKDTQATMVRWCLESDCLEQEEIYVTLEGSNREAERKGWNILILSIISSLRMTN